MGGIQECSFKKLTGFFATESRQLFGLSDAFLQSNGTNEWRNPVLTALSIPDSQR